MMTAQRFTDAELMAYVDGEVDDEKAREIEAAAAADTEIARTIDVFARSKVMVQDAFSPVLRETVPPHLMASALGRSSNEASPSTSTGDVVGLKARMGARRPSVFAVGMAMAASVAVIAAGVVGYIAGSGSTGGRVDGLEIAVASEEISQLLRTAPAGAEETVGDGSTLRIISSFRDGGDRFCREFEVSAKAGGSLAVACQRDGDWAVEFAMHTTAPGGYEPASSTAVLDSYLDQIGAGAPLSPDEERTLLERMNPGN